MKEFNFECEKCGDKRSTEQKLRIHIKIKHKEKKVIMDTPKEEVKMGLLASRQKFWKELTADEKIERLRERIKTYEDMHSRMADLELLLNEHSHKENGDIVTNYKLNGLLGKPLRSGGNCFGCEKCREEVLI